MGIERAGAITVAVWFLSGCVAVPAEAVLEEGGERRQYTYAWQFVDEDKMRPRGGTTEGPAVVLDRQPGDAWTRLREAGLSKFERDRRAILSMAGPYRTTFDFIETVGFVPGYEPARPYQSWGTEYVYVVTDQPRFISLQHIIVMFFKEDDGSIGGPAVVKHWRQDWTYEDRSLHSYVGDNTWEERELSPAFVQGAWSQAVYQVDDSPRYEALGRWEHGGNYSSWVSENTWRPLPRREFSVRDDYQALAGTNRHTVTPTGWVHEENNLKLVLAGPGEPREHYPYLAKETGLNRYERILDHDFSAGDAYWARTAPFWADVRAAWEEVKAENQRFTLASEIDGKRLFEVMFEYAGEIPSAEFYDSPKGREYIDETLSRWVSGT